VMDRAVTFIRQAVADQKPFLTLIWFHAPHQPVKAGDAYRQRYADRRGKEQHYYGCITALDEQVGRLRAELKELGVADNTLFWFVSDNGPEGKADQAPGSAAPLKGRKRDLWEGGIRVPGILEYPAVVKTARVIDAPCVTSDFLPTALDYAGLKIDGPAPLDGISLKPLIEGQISERPQGIGFEYAKMAAWIDNRFKLVALLDDVPADAKPKPAAQEPGTKVARQGKIKFASPELIAPVRQYLLFDIVNDPGEEHDLASQQSARADEMAAALANWRKSCRDSVAELRDAE
jgi:arylsulfatase A-like enzyme